jgi:hypothetical protein
MRKLVLFGMLLSVLVWNSSCHRTKVGSGKSDKKADNKVVIVPDNPINSGHIKEIPEIPSEGVFYSLQKIVELPLRGQSEDFKLSVFSNRTCLLEKKNSKGVGQSWVTSLTKYQFKTLEKWIEQAGLVSLNSKYPNYFAPSIPDFPVFKHQLVSEKKIVNIVNNYDAPPRLFKLEKNIETFIAELDWILID